MSGALRGGAGQQCVTIPVTPRHALANACTDVQGGAARGSRRVLRTRGGAAHVKDTGRSGECREQEEERGLSKTKGGAAPVDITIEAAVEDEGRTCRRSGACPGRGEKQRKSRARG